MLPRSLKTLVVAGALSVTLQAQAAPIELNLPAQPLAQALRQFGDAAGITLLVDDNLVAQRTAPALRGRFEVETALRRLLAGSTLQVRQQGSVWVIYDPQANVLDMDSTVVRATQLGAVTEGTGSYTSGSNSTATRLPLSLRETPQSVTVVTRQRMDDQGMTSLGDVLKNTTGLSVRKWGGEREQYISRGFEISNLMIDGLPIQYEEAALSTGLMGMYDRVEVVRGAAGLMEGAGNPAGSINLIRKRPTREFQAQVEGSAGSWDNYRGELDVGGPLNEQGSLRGRTVISYQDRNSFIDDYANERSLAYGILEADLDDSTTLSLGASYSKDHNPGADWNGLGTAADGSFLPVSRSTRMSPSWSYWNKQSRVGFLELEHRFDNDWKARAAATWIYSRMDMLGTFLNSATTTADGGTEYTLRGGAYSYDRDQKSFDGYASGPFEAFGRSHSLVFGASHRTSEYTDGGAATTLNGSFDIATFNPLNWDPKSLDVPPIGAFGYWKREQEVKQSGLYGTTRLSLSEPLSLILGARLDWYELDVQQYDGDYPYGAANYKVTREFTPYAGIVYDLNATYSVYASWTRIFNPQNYQTASGSLLEPQRGTNYEIGLKGEYLDGRLNASVALFQIDMENLPDQLPTSQCQTSTTCYAAAGEVRSRGIELELNGEITENWHVAAGYTYNSAERVKDSDYDPTSVFSQGKRYGTNLPQNLFKLSTVYRLPGELEHWKVGGGVRTQSRIYTPYGVQQGGYSVVDLFSSYAVNSHLDLQLNVNNLFDKRYYSSISEPIGGNFFGDPRNVLLSARYRF